MNAALEDGSLGRAVMMHNFHRNVEAPAELHRPNGDHEFRAA